MSFNPFSRMRAMNIWNPPDENPGQSNLKRFLSKVNPTPQADFNTPPEEEDSPSQYFKHIQDLQKTGPAVTAYQQKLKEMPTQNDYQPSKWRRFGGALAGGLTGFASGPQAGAAAGRSVLESPYNSAMGEYNNQIKGLGESARLEQDDNENRIKAASTAAALGLDYKRFAHTQDKDWAAQRTNDRNVDSQMKDRTTRAEIAGRVANTGEAAQKATSIFQQGSLKNMDRTAATGERNAATGEMNANSLEKYRTALGNSADKKRVSPSQQRFAIQGAYEQLKNDPEFGSDFVSVNDSGIYSTNEAMMDRPAQLQLFRQKLKALTNAIISKGTPYDDDEHDDEDDDITIGRPY